MAAGRPISGMLPPVAHADGEVSTNIPFSAALDVAGRFCFDLSFLATPSNNVEVAFGNDVNFDGVLELEEIDRIVGWDCGAWFTRRRADGVYVWAVADSTNEMRILSWKVQVGADGSPSRLTAVSDGGPVFADLPLESVYRSSWNLIRLSGRGFNASLERFSVSLTSDGTVFFMR